MKYRDEINNEKELARAYIKFQTMNQVYNQREALKMGTLFPELLRPYKQNEYYQDGGRNYYV